MTPAQKEENKSKDKPKSIFKSKPNPNFFKQETPLIEND